MQPTQERKAPPPVEVSANYASWSLKDLVKSVNSLVEAQLMIKQELESMNAALKLMIPADKAPF